MQKKAKMETAPGMSMIRMETVSASAMRTAAQSADSMMLTENSLGKVRERTDQPGYKETFQKALS